MVDEMTYGPAAPLYALLHKADPLFCQGKALPGHAPAIKALIDKTGAKTLLDYGCGKGWQYFEQKVHEQWGIMPTLYDPGVEGVQALPDGKFDGVICTDVLEHTDDPECEVNTLLAYADKFLFLAVSCLPSAPNKHRLSDGRPLHISVYPPEWWRELVGRLHGEAHSDAIVEMSFDVER